MTAVNLDQNKNGPANPEPVETMAGKIEEVDLVVEELEDVIAPKLAANHNETMVSDPH